MRELTQRQWQSDHVTCCRPKCLNAQWRVFASARAVRVVTSFMAVAPIVTLLYPSTRTAATSRSEAVGLIF